MENQIYRIYGTESSRIEFSIIDTNEIEPYKDIKEVAVDFIDGKNEFPFTMELSEAKSLLKYLDNAIDFCEDFNHNSEPKEE